MSGQFNWESDCVVLRTQPALAVCTNGEGEIELIQPRAMMDEDSVIFIQPENARAVAEAILTEAAKQLDRARPANSGAERQRRYRENKRLGVTAERNASHERDAGRDVTLGTRKTAANVVPLRQAAA